PGCTHPRVTPFDRLRVTGACSVVSERASVGRRGCMSESCNRLTVTRRSALVVAAIAAMVLPAAPGLAQSSVTVIVNGQTMSFDQPPIVRNGRVFVPLRGIFEQLGASVVYANGQINATGNNRTVSLTIGSTQATVNGQSQILDVAPFIVGSRTLVPLRFI